MAHAPVEILRTHTIDDALATGLEAAYVEVFGDWDFDQFLRRVPTHAGFSLFVATVDDAVVGFKAGRNIDFDRYHSSLGLVRPAFRRQGIARQLMAAQHAWCREHGYVSVRTRTRNAFPEMILLNLAVGFTFDGVFTEGAEPKLVFTRDLVAEPATPPNREPPVLDGFFTAWGSDRAGLADHVRAGHRIEGSLTTADGHTVALMRAP